jgi:SAM-dependent methyltransferase
VDHVITDPDAISDAYLEEIAPDLVITNACALLSADLIERLHARGCEIINVHNGLNPRYRGTGNIWAIYERNFTMAGVTLHHIDAGIDTGETIATRHLDFLSSDTAFTQIDVIALEEGARMAAQYASQCKVPSDPVPMGRSRAYTFPNYDQYKKAAVRYAAAQHLTTGLETKTSFKAIFEDLADGTDDVTKHRQHWGDTSTILERDRLVRWLVDTADPGTMILDLGCEDGRYRHFWPHTTYWGCDFSLSMMALEGDVQPVRAPDGGPLRVNTTVLGDGNGAYFVEADIVQLPFKDAQVSTLLGVGLFQHLDNTGAVADEMLRVLSTGGRMILNTLRQPSWLELTMARAMGLINSEMRALASAISRQDYFGTLEINGTKVARRYSLAELRLLFAPQAQITAVRYNGLFGSWLLAREITVVFEKTR